MARSTPSICPTAIPVSGEITRHFDASQRSLLTIVRTFVNRVRDLSLPNKTWAMTTYDTGTPIVELADDHPGVSDPEYLRRRDEIAHAAVGLQAGDVAPHIDYTATENATWATAQQALGELHRQHACAAYLDGVARLDLPDPTRTATRRRVPPAPGAHRVDRRGCPRAGPDPRVLRRPRQSTLPVDSIRAPPVRPALHAGTGRDPRGRRPLQLAGERRSLPSSMPRQGRPASEPTTTPCSASPRRSGSRSSSGWCGRSAISRRTAPGCCRASGR